MGSQLKCGSSEEEDGRDFLGPRTGGWETNTLMHVNDTDCKQRMHVTYQIYGETYWKNDIVSKFSNLILGLVV